jgi:hypothetical protein
VKSGFRGSLNPRKVRVLLDEKLVGRSYTTGPSFAGTRVPHANNMAARMPSGWTCCDVEEIGETRGVSPLALRLQEAREHDAGEGPIGCTRAVVDGGARTLLAATEAAKRAVARRMRPAL